MESRDVLKIQGALRRYCTSRVSLRSTLEVQYLLNLLCIFNTSLDSMVYLLIIPIVIYICSYIGTFLKSFAQDTELCIKNILIYCTNAICKLSTYKNYILSTVMF